jgi:hypothetical protein
VASGAGSSTPHTAHDAGTFRAAFKTRGTTERKTDEARNSAILFEKSLVSAARLN